MSFDYFLIKPDILILREGFSAIIHIHTAVEEVKIERLLGKFNKKTKKMEKFSGAKFLKQGDQGICRFRLDNVVAMEKDCGLLSFALMSH